MMMDTDDVDESARGTKRSITESNSLLDAGSALSSFLSPNGSNNTTNNIISMKRPRNEDGDDTALPSSSLRSITESNSLLDAGSALSSFLSPTGSNNTTNDIISTKRPRNENGDDTSLPSSSLFVEQQRDVILPSPEVNNAEEYTSVYDLIPHTSEILRGKKDENNETHPSPQCYPETEITSNFSAVTIPEPLSIQDNFQVNLNPTQRPDLIKSEEEKHHPHNPVKEVRTLTQQSPSSPFSILNCILLSILIVTLFTLLPLYHLIQESLTITLLQLQSIHHHHSILQHNHTQLQGDMHMQHIDHNRLISTLEEQARDDIMDRGQKCQDDIMDREKLWIQAESTIRKELDLSGDKFLGALDQFQKEKQSLEANIDLLTQSSEAEMNDNTLQINHLKEQIQGKNDMVQNLSIQLEEKKTLINLLNDEQIAKEKNEKLTQSNNDDLYEMNDNTHDALGTEELIESLKLIFKEKLQEKEATIQNLNMVVQGQHITQKWMTTVEDWKQQPKMCPLELSNDPEINYLMNTLEEDEELISFLKTEVKKDQMLLFLFATLFGGLLFWNVVVQKKMNHQ